MTAACDRDCVPVLAYLLVTKEGKKRKGGEQKRTTDRKSTQLMGIQAEGIIKKMCGGEGGRGELVCYIGS